MTSFRDYWQTFDPLALQEKISQQTSAHVERALQVNQIGINELIALLSPAAANYLDIMAQRAQQLTRQRFGNNIALFAPLYLSNLCSSDCSYCGFSIRNKIRRKTLNSVEIDAESQALKALGFHSILLVTGEHPGKVGINYFLQHFPAIRRQFSSLMMEIQPLSTDEYRNLKQAGLDGVLVYQETYDQTAYAAHHLRGKKQDFYWRLETPDRLGCAGIDKIGLGILVGLSNSWQADAVIMAQHLNYLQHHYWRSRYSVAFPRLRPCVGGVAPRSLMSERQLLQAMCAFRLFAPEVEISLSTRESPYFRDHAIPITVTTTSAFSNTSPGGYANSNQYLAQFSPDDRRRPEIVAAALRQAGLQPVWKDWEPFMGRSHYG